MRLSYKKYNVARGLVRVKTKTALVLSAMAIALGSGGGLSLVRSGNVNAITPAWNMNGVYTLDFEYSGTHYVHDATVTGQDNGDNFAIAGGYAAGAASYDYAWNGAGSLTGTALTMSVNYTIGAPGTHMNMSGTVASDGTLSGTWTDNYGGARSGTWTSASGAASPATVVVVTPTNAHGWAFFDDNEHGGSGSFVSGPGTPPLGMGSAQLGVNGSTQGLALGGSITGATPLTSLTSASYSTYAQQGNSLIAPALQFNIDKDVTDSSASYQGRLVYEPYMNGTVTDGRWQHWNAAAGKWWLSKSATLFNGNCAQASPCTFGELVALYPHIGTLTGVGNVVFKAGSGWNVPFIGSVDAFTFGTSAGTSTYDFEPFSPITNKDACKNDGWKTAVAVNGASFKNQGACVSYVASNGKSQH